MTDKKKPALDKSTKSTKPVQLEEIDLVRVTGGLQGTFNSFHAEDRARAPYEVTVPSSPDTKKE